MFTRFAARSISTLETEASFKLVSIYLRTFMSSCSKLHSLSQRTILTPSHE